MRAVGIDIGSGNIKVVEVLQTNKGLLISKFYEHALGQSLVNDPALEVVEFLHGISKQYNPEQWRIVVGLRQEMVAVRNKIFPFNDRLKILKSLPFELEEEIPFSPDNAVFDVKIIKTMGTSAEVLACAVPKARIRDIMAGLQEAGLDISILSCEAAALANCQEAWDDAAPNQAGTQFAFDGVARPARAVQIIIEMGHSHCLVTAFDDDHLVGLRSILWGGKNLIEALAKKYEIPAPEAAKVLETKAFILLSQENASYDQIVFSETITKSLKDFTRDLQMTLMEFQSEFNGRASSISLVGGVSRIQNLNAFLTQQLEIPVNPTSLIRNRFATAFELSPHVEAVANIALGLAIEGLKKPRNPALNFLRQEFQKQNLKLVRLWEKWGTLAKYAAAVFVLFVVYAMAREQISSGLADKASEAMKNQAKAVAKISGKQANEAGIKKYLQEQRKRSQEIRDIQSLAKMNSAMDVLRKISDGVPGKSTVSLDIRRINIQANRVEIEGSVTNQHELTTLRNSLNGVSANGKVDTIRPTGMVHSGVPFAFAFPVDRGMTSK